MKFKTIFFLKVPDKSDCELSHQLWCCCAATFYLTCLCVLFKAAPFSNANFPRRCSIVGWCSAEIASYTGSVKRLSGWECVTHTHTHSARTQCTGKRTNWFPARGNFLFAQMMREALFASLSVLRSARHIVSISLCVCLHCVCECEHTPAAAAFDTHACRQ